MPPPEQFAEVSAAARRHLGAGRAAVIARPVAFAGVSSRIPGQSVLVGAGGEVVGGVLGRSITDAVAGVARDHLDGPRRGRVRLEISDPQAADAGLSCGGLITVAVDPVAALPALLWSAGEAGTAVAVVSGPGGALAVTTDAVDGTVGTAIDGDAVLAARRALEAGVTAVGDIEVGGETLLLEVHVPPITVAVVGGGEIAAALVSQTALLGWHCEVVDGERAGAAAAGSLGPADALVVLSHDHAVDTPALAAALASAVGYIGALGSRHTQAGRRQRLADRGIGPDAIARIHGPAGLDLGGRRPAEIALSICAEIVAHRHGRAPATRGGDRPLSP